jgi:hypothetical protein
VDGWEGGATKRQNKICIEWGGWLMGNVYKVMVYIIFISFPFFLILVVVFISFTQHTKKREKKNCIFSITHIRNEREREYNVISSIFLHNKIEGCAIPPPLSLSLALLLTHPDCRVLSYPKEPIIFLLHNIFACDRMRIIFFYLDIRKARVKKKYFFCCSFHDVEGERA